jgi:4-amino-4-deoxy-L-arabinose transferase-like glycosyltransferase
VPWIVPALLAWILGVEIASERHQSVTYDEPRHFQYGQQLLSGDASRFDDSKMPVSVLNALTSRVGAATRGQPYATDLERVAGGRLATMLFSLVAAFCVWRWATELYGPSAGVLSLSLVALEPNVIAHAQLVTTDVYGVGTMAWAFYAFWRFQRDGGRRWAAMSAATFALSQLAKYTAVFLAPLYVVIALAFYSRRTGWRSALGGAVRFALLTAVLTLVVINVGFLFDRTLTPLAGYTFRSELFQDLQRDAGVLGRVPIPLPYPYLEGLDWIVQRERTGEGYGPIYLRGALREGRGFAGYYLVATLYKVPLAILGAWLLSLLTCVRRPPTRDEWVLLCPLLFFTVYFNFLYRAQIGLRFYLVTFPLLHVLAGRLVRDWPEVRRPARAALAMGGAWALASMLRSYPYFIPYFNELAGNRMLAYKILADSNVDWGQHVAEMRRYEAAHPGLIVEPEVPTVGMIAVGVNALTGVTRDFDKFQWLRDHFTPVDHIAYSTLVFRVRQEDLDRLGLGARPSR